MAIKIVPKSRKGEAHAFQSIEKEALLHKTANHPNIARLLDLLEDSHAYYLVQEYCEGGELFDRLEPDLGFPEAVAHFYFVQLLSAIDYLHQRGICHRDIKPENLLLDAMGNLKIADFGFATLFQRGDRRRRLQTRCGSLLYMAPEVLGGAYEGDAVDLWSCAVVLVVMLLGCHPWEEASARCSLFRRFVRDPSSLSVLSSRWTTLDAHLCSLVVRLLAPAPADRPSWTQIYRNPWLAQPNRLLGHHLQCADPSLLLSLVHPAGGGEGDCERGLAEWIPALTQPEALLSNCSVSQSPRPKNCHFRGFSQPSLTASNLSLVGEAPRTEEGFDSSLHTRLTHAFCSESARGTMARIKLILDQLLVAWRATPIPLHLTLSTVDRRKTPISAEVIVLETGDCTCMVVIRKHRGDWLEFKRLARLILAKMPSS